MPDSWQWVASPLATQLYGEGAVPARHYGAGVAGADQRYHYVGNPARPLWGRWDRYGGAQ